MFLMYIHINTHTCYYIQESNLNCNGSSGCGLPRWLVVRTRPPVQDTRSPLVWGGPACRGQLSPSPAAAWAQAPHQGASPRGTARSLQPESSQHSHEEPAQKKVKKIISLEKRGGHRDRQLLQLCFSQMTCILTQGTVKVCCLLIKCSIC